MPVIDCDITDAREKLEAAGATIFSGNTQHERWRAELEGSTIVAYEDKVVIQGQNTEVIRGILQDSAGRVHLYFDGASRGNPGPAAVGWVLVSDDGIIAEGTKSIGNATNNQAEYEALIEGLRAARAHGFNEIQIRGDSKLVVNQVRGAWSANNPILREKRVEVIELLEGFDNWLITHVPRELNDHANDLANEALDR